MAGGVIVARRMGGAKGAFPDFIYNGACTIVDTGVTSKRWVLALTGSGKFTLNKKTNAIIQIQGGGGGSGAGNAETTGSDGADGESKSLTTALEAGEYMVEIGAGGDRGVDAAGTAGGMTAFAGMLTANGGAGGAHMGGNAEQAHTSIYTPLGTGGIGGGMEQFIGQLRWEYIATMTYGGYIYIKQTPNKRSANMGQINSGEKQELEDLTTYPDETGDTEFVYYKLANGMGYVDKAKFRVDANEIDERKWVGMAGNPGVILISGRA